MMLWGAAGAGVLATNVSVYGVNFNQRILSCDCFRSHSKLTEQYIPNGQLSMMQHCSTLLFLDDDGLQHDLHWKGPY